MHFYCTETVKFACLWSNALIRKGYSYTMDYNEEKQQCEFDVFYDHGQPLGMEEIGQIDTLHDQLMTFVDNLQTSLQNPNLP